MDADGALALLCLPFYCFICCCETPKTNNGVVVHPGASHCRSRISLLITLLILSFIYFCIGILGITEFYSTTDTYKNAYKKGLVKHLKAIEIGMGGIIFIFPIIFLGVSIAFLVFTCGRREYQVLPEKNFITLNILKILCIVISSILIALSFIYSVLINIIFHDIHKDKSVNIMLGYFFMLYYILSVSLFSVERKHFYLVGTSTAPGPYAWYDLNYQPIIRAQAVNIVSPSYVVGQVPINQMYPPNSYIQNVFDNQKPQNLYIKQNLVDENSENRMNKEKATEKKSIDLNVNNKNWALLNFIYEFVFIIKYNCYKWINFIFLLIVNYVIIIF